MNSGFKYIALAIFGSALLCTCGDKKSNKVPNADNTEKMITYEAVKIKRFPLPFKHLDSLKKIRLSAPEYIERLRFLESLRYKIERDTIPLLEKQRKLYDIKGQIGILNDHAFLNKIETICGDIDNSVNVEQYAMKNGVPVGFMAERARSVGLIRWNTDLKKYFKGKNDNAGDVAGVHWGSGCLIGQDTFITAGHCFDSMVNGNRTPVRNGIPLTGKQFAQYMNVIFNYQKLGSSEKIRNDTVSFPILDLLEYREGGLDYAIIKLGKNKAGRTAGEDFGVVKLASIDYTNKKGDTLLIIQHPDGEPKRIDCGPLFFIDGDYLFYDKIDTKAVSSGAPVINYYTGVLAAVHVMGGCTATDGSNQGLKIQSVRQHSKILH